MKIAIKTNLILMLVFLLQVALQVTWAFTPVNRGYDEPYCEENSSLETDISSLSSG